MGNCGVVKSCIISMHASAQVSAKVVKQLRDKSGAGMMDCKKALAECDGDVEAAADYLRKKGLISAGKKAGRVASDGAVGAYIHAGSRYVLHATASIALHCCKTCFEIMRLQKTFVVTDRLFFSRNSRERHIIFLV